MVGPSLDGRQESKTVAYPNSKARSKAQSYLKKAKSCCLVLLFLLFFFCTVLKRQVVAGRIGDRKQSLHLTFDTYDDCDYWNVDFLFFFFSFSRKKGHRLY